MGGGGFDPSAMDLGDILGQVFGLGDLFGGRSSGGRNRPMKGDDLRYDLSLTFEEAVFGKAVEIQVPKLELCPRCEGKGAEPGSGSITCPGCQGRGEQLFSQGFSPYAAPVRTAAAPGRLSSRSAANAGVRATGMSTSGLKVTIPAGIGDGNRLRVSSEGQPGANGGPAGDLYIFFAVKEHEIFERQGSDIHCTVPINVSQAVLGATIPVPTLEGPHSLEIPEGTQSGTELKVRGKGVPELQGRGRGDLIVHLEVKIPTRLTREQRQIFEQLRETLPVDNDPDQKGLLDKVKEYFT